LAQDTADRLATALNADASLRTELRRLDADALALLERLLEEAARAQHADISRALAHRLDFVPAPLRPLLRRLAR
jgi:hypothetical protein